MRWSASTRSSSQRYWSVRRSRSPKVCRKAPVDLSLLDASGVVPFHLVAELVLLFYIVSIGVEQIEVVIGVLAGYDEFCPQFVTAAL